MFVVLILADDVLHSSHLEPQNTSVPFKEPFLFLQVFSPHFRNRPPTEVEG